jgi:hypothetical protein
MPAPPARAFPSLLTSATAVAGAPVVPHTFSSATVAVVAAATDSADSVPSLVPAKCTLRCGCTPSCACLCQCLRLQTGRVPFALNSYFLVLIVDTRERVGGALSQIVEAFRQQVGARGISVFVEREKLEVGDYLWVWRQNPHQAQVLSALVSCAFIRCSLRLNHDHHLLTLRAVLR